VAGGLGHARLIGRVEAEVDVVADTVGEEEYVLRHVANLLAQGRERIVAHIHTIDLNVTARHVVEAAEQGSHRAFARACVADNSQRVAGLDAEAYVAQGLDAGVGVGKRDMVEDDVALNLLVYVAARDNVSFLVQELVDAGLRGFGPLHQRRGPP
nr:hypothetical protein [Tanacetum cinerariifolium]